MEIQTVGELKRRCEEEFNKVYTAIATVLENPTEAEGTEVQQKIDNYKKELQHVTDIFKENKELRYGNLVSAYNEVECMVSIEGKGILQKLEKEVKKQEKQNVQELLNQLKEKHSLMTKFLETESKVEITIKEEKTIKAPEPQSHQHVADN